MYNQGMFDFHSVQTIINAYYKAPEETLTKFGIRWIMGQESFLGKRKRVQAI